MSGPLPALVLALGLGLLVGLQREWSTDRTAGIRTFAFITLFGGLAAILVPEAGGWLLGAGMLALAALLVLANQLALRGTDPPSPGITTEIAALVMYCVGAAAVLGWTVEGVVVGAGTAILLHWKAPIHRVVRALSADDLKVLLQLVLVAFIVLPLLPDRAFGPYPVLNPFRIWLMVVLIVGISAGAYAAQRLLGARGGTLAAGALGGLISSTATSVSQARRAARGAPEIPASAAVIVLASAVALARVLVELAVVSPGLFRATAAPLALVGGVLLTGSVGLWRSARLSAIPEPHPPTDLRAAILFGLTYALILVAVAFTRRHLGTEALYGVAALSGLTDVDAITLSTAQLVQAGRVDLATGWRVVLLGSLANLVFKAGAVAVLGPRALVRRIGPAFGAALATGGAVLALWPD